MCGGRRSRRSWSAGSGMRQRQVAETPAAAAGRPISVRFCESPATCHSLTSFTELDARPPSGPPALDNAGITSPSVIQSYHFIIHSSSSSLSLFIIHF